MKMHFILLAIPAFFLLMGFEYFIARKKHLTLYRLSDSIANISCGILEQLALFFEKGLLFASYIFLYHYCKIFHISEHSIWAWIAVFILVDFCYYWFHRASHRVNLFWVGHIVHHQSEEFNFSVALRQGIFQDWVSWIFYLPLAVLGFSPLMFVIASSFTTLYQFWIHTELVRTLGPLEWIFNTPQHHRVHHGTNPEYLDKNYAGTLIIWDRLFGTFEPEKARAVYGTTKPLNSWNPLFANLKLGVELIKNTRQLKGMDKLRLWLKPPGWQPGAEVYQHQLPSVITKYKTKVSNLLKSYVFLQYVFLLLATVYVLFNLYRWSLGWKILAVSMIVFSVLSLTGILDKRLWAFQLEKFRLFFIFVTCIVLFARIFSLV